MKDEIKQMIDNLKFISEQKSATIEINQNGCKVILDYITNLQEENKKSNNIINELENFVQDEYRSPSENEIEWEVGLFVDKIKELKENK